MVAAVALTWSLVSTRLGWWLGLPILLALGGTSVLALPAELEGQRISSIRFEPERQPLTNAQLLAMIPLRIGEPLRAEAVRNSIQALYATGEYSDIAVDGTPGSSGVELRILTKPSYFIAHVAAQGVQDPPNEGQLVIASKLQLGAPYSEADLAAATQRLVDLLTQNGFYHADVQPTVTLQDRTQQAQIGFSIVTGKRAKFDGLNATGNPERPLDKLILSSGWKRFHGWFGGWQTLTDNRLRNGVDGMRAWYPKHDRLLARVSLASLDYHSGTNTVTPTVDFNSGPPVRVRVRQAKVSNGTLRNLLPIYEERSVDRDLLEEGSRDLAAYFQSKGYFDARASYNMTALPTGEQFIDYTVEQGDRHKLVKLQIEGNRYFDSRTLRERLTISPAAWPRFPHGRYSRSNVERDLNSIRDVYRANGFRDVEVTSREIDDYDGKKGQIALSIQVKEGPQWFVSRLELLGVTEGDRAALLLVLHSTAGQPYSDLNIATDRDSVLEYFYNNGYPAATFEFNAQPAEEPNHVSLKFEVTAGRREFVRGVLVSGLARTREDLVRQRIDLAPGEPLSRDKITGSQRRLYDLGIFARVDAGMQNPDTEEPDKYVLYSVEEAGRYSTTYGFGAEIGRIGGGSTTLDSPAGTTGFSPRASFGVSRLNFLGLGHTLGLQTLASTLEQRALVNYLAPQFQGSPKLSLQFTGLFDISHDVRTFSARREEGSVQLAQKWNKSFTQQYRVTFRKVNILGTPLVTPELIPLLSQPVRVGFVSTTFIEDRRDDPLDAHRGIYSSLDVALATDVLGSQTGFGRVVARNSTYYPITKNVVFARSTNFGLIERFAGTPEIPLAERFFGGGAFSNRAFPDFQAGPRDPETGFPIGGDALFVNTVELRFPLIGDSVTGVLFNDLGNVYSAVNRISLRFHQNNLQDFDYAVQSFGFGVRYRTPVGPVRLDLSLSPNSPRFFGFKGTENELLFGGGQQVTQRINVFQFHFSLGQAF